MTELLVRRLDSAAERLAGLDDHPRLSERPRVVACCLGLAALAFLTRSGFVLADTKLDLSLDPLRFLGTALHLWNPGQMGQVQNQAAGYLFPTGPFFAGCAAIGMPMWIAQRIWIAMLLCAAFLGARRLAERLGIGTPSARLAGAMAYALTPNGLSVLGQISSEYLPYAMLPWTVAPLVTAGGSPRRAAARSGLAIALCGGINGTATVAAVLVPLLYLLTRRRLRLLAWWSVAVAAASAWWAVPLVLDGRYAFSWLTYTEKTAVTTGPTGLMNIFRGTERWVSYLAVNGRIESPVGHALATTALGIVCTTVVAALGLAGLTSRTLPERRFVLGTLLTGALIISSGHTGPLAGQVRELIDGPFAPLRNLHKFDGLVRLPLALGLIHLLATVRRPRARVGVFAAATAALSMVAATAALCGLSASGDFEKVPGYWREAAAWLNGRTGDQSVIALPGSAVGDYRWGRTGDDAMQPLLKVRWGARQLVPWGSPGFTRILDALDQRIAGGAGSAGLAEMVARLGVRYVVVRNDLAPGEGSWPARVHEVIEGSPGFTEVASFGATPKVPDEDAAGTFDQPYPPVQIYQVAGAGPIVSLADAGSALHLYGAPEALLTLADAGRLGSRPVLLNDDAADLPGVPVVSDSLRAVGRNFGVPWQVTPTLTREEAAAGVRDVLAPGWARYTTYAQYAGIRSVAASSSGSDTTFLTDLHDLSNLPYAAVDGDPGTRWESSGLGGVDGQWLRVDFTQARSPDRVSVAFARDPSLGPAPELVEVRTEAGALRQRAEPTAAAQTLRVPAGPTRWLRLQILRTEPGRPATSFPRVAISELTIDGIRAERSYRLPAVPADTAVMARSPGATPACMRGSVAWVCSPFLARGGEDLAGFDRTFSIGRTTAATISGTATVTAPGLVDRYTAPRGSVRVTASSSLTTHPADQGRSALDGDPATVWTPAPADRDPALTLSLPKPVRISALDIDRLDPGHTGLWVRLDGDPRTWAVTGAGHVSFPPRTTKRLTIHFVSFAAPPQISEVRIPGVGPDTAPGTRPVVVPCGSGPRLLLGGVPVPTRAVGTVADLLSARPIRFQACGAVPVLAGDNRLSAPAGDAFRVDSAVVGQGDPPAAGTPLTAGTPPADGTQPADGTLPVTVRHWAEDHREVQVHADRQSLLVVDENFNGGWQAKSGSTVLRAVRVDGWKQAWLVPAGTDGTIRLVYRPDRIYRAAVFTGLGLLPLMLAGALLPARRERERRPPPVPVTWALPIWALAGLAACMGFWLAGPAGAVGAAFVVVLPRRVRSPWAPLALVTAGVAAEFAGAAPALPQLAGVLILAVLSSRPEPAVRSAGG